MVGDGFDLTVVASVVTRQRGEPAKSSPSQILGAPTSSACWRQVPHHGPVASTSSGPVSSSARGRRSNLQCQDIGPVDEPLIMSSSATKLIPRRKRMERMVHAAARYKNRVVSDGPVTQRRLDQIDMFGVRNHPNVWSFDRVGLELELRVIGSPRVASWVAARRVRWRHVDKVDVVPTRPLVRKASLTPDTCQSSTSGRPSCSQRPVRRWLRPPPVRGGDGDAVRRARICSMQRV